MCVGASCIVWRRSYRLHIYSCTDLSSKLCNFSSSLMCVKWEMPKSNVISFRSWSGRTLKVGEGERGGQSVKVREILPRAIFWTVWQEATEELFKEESSLVMN